MFVNSVYQVTEVGSKVLFAPISGQNSGSQELTSVNSGAPE